MPSNIKKLWYFFRQKYGQILLILLLLIVCFVSIRWGQHLLSNDNYSPELNPGLSVSRYIESPAWRGYRVLGIPSDSEQADIFRSVLFGILKVFIPSWFLAQFYSLLCLFIGTLSMATLTSYFVRDFVNTKKSGYVFFISGLIYLSSLWTAWVFNFNMMPYIAQYGFLPLLLLSIYLLMRDYKLSRVFLLFISTILFVSVSVIGTLFFVNIVVLLFAFAYFGYLHRVKLRGIVKAVLLFIAVQLFWLLPFAIFTKNISNDVVNSYTNRSITANTIDLEKQMLNLPNAARFYTRLLGTVDTPEPETFIFPLSEEFMNYDFYRVVGLLPIFFSLVGLVFLFVKKEFKLIPIWVMMLGLLFLIKNQNPPFGQIYVWLQENINLFKQVFRWVSSKLGQQYLILLTITSTIGFLLFLNFLSSFFKKIPKYVFILFSLALVTFPLFLYTEYIFRGDLFTKRATVEIPNEYFELAKFLEDDSHSRIYYAPPSNNGYFREYDWGFVGSQFISYVLPNPIMDMSLAIGSDVGEKAMLEFRNIYDSGNAIQFNEVLKKYDVGYVLVDKSLVKGRYGHELNWDVLEGFIQNMKLVWEKDFLKLYKVNPSETKYVETLGSSESLINGTFTRVVQRDPSFSLLNFDLSNLKIEKNALTKSIPYLGNPTTLYLSNMDLGISQAPIFVQKIGNKIRISPALPSLEGIKNNSFKEAVVDSSSSVFIIGTYVFENKTLEEGINIDVPYEDIQNIGYVKENEFVENNLTNIFSSSLPGDCSGGGYKIMPDIKQEEIASGFKIEGFSELPCVYTNLRLDKRFSYVGSVSFNWESDSNSIFGYCLYSEKYGGCLNREKYFSSSEGFGQKTITVPRVIEAGDKLSLTLYTQNPLGKKVGVTIRDVKVKFAPYFTTANISKEFKDNEKKVLTLEGKGQELKLNIPILYGDSSFVYTEKFGKDSIWRLSVAEDGTLPFEATYEGGMRQYVQNQLINQFDTTLSTVPNSKYLWYWEGQNIKNIPSNLCLTYQGSDRCWVDDTFHPSKTGSSTRIFTSSSIFSQKLDISFNSISFSNDSENILKNFVLMKIPEAWKFNSYSASLMTNYSEIELEPVGRSGIGYKLGKDKSLGRSTIVSIPQAKSESWLALGFGDGKLKIFGNKEAVYLNGWKQGWDIEGIDYSSFYVFYWPNFLSYLGYLLISVIFVVLVYKLIKSNKYAI